MMPFYLICNTGTFMESPVVLAYTWHMLLAQVVKPRLSAYQERVTQIRKQRGTLHSRIILDNGAYEGAMLNDASLLEVATAIKPNTLVLPDLPGASGSDSFAKSMDFMYRARESLPYFTRYMCCPQGSSKEDVIETIQRTISHYDPERLVMGLGLCYKHWQEPEDGDVKSEKARMRMWHDLCPIFDAHPNLEIHILGSCWTGTRAFGARPRVIGIDGYKPCMAALQERIFSAPPKCAYYRIAHEDVRCASETYLLLNLGAMAEEYGCRIS